MPNYNSTLKTNNSSLEEIITQLNNMPDAGGTDTSDATATSGDILSGKTAYVKGSKVTGNIATKTSSNLTANGATVTVPAGYYSTQATKSVSTATQATPAISVNSSTGLITATATQTAGYVTAGTKSATSQLAFKAATTITPGTTNQTAVAANTYVGGAITVKGDANLVASNIVSGKSIFGVVGTATAGGSGESSSPFTYTVDDVSGASYGFALNGDGYYESQNKGKSSSSALCRVILNVTSVCDIVFDVINYAESRYDYAIFSNLDAAFSTSASADSSNIKKNFYSEHSESVVNVTYSDVSVGTHTIDIKFIKDGSQDKNNDSVQFKIQGGSSGNSSGGGGDTSAEDGIIDKTISGTYINDRVSKISDNIFYLCTYLTAVSFSAATAIGSSAFCYCSRLTTVSFPKATHIGSNAFCGCSSLTTADFPKVIYVEQNAFSSCYKLKTANFPETYTIGSGAFYSCISLTTASFPKATYIGDSAFCRCSVITASFPAATTIEGGAFYTCTNLATISIPAVTAIYSSAFRQCSALTTISLPAITNISGSAFRGCVKLVSLYLTGSSVCKLSASTAFSSTPIGGYSTSAKKYGSIYVPASLLTSYKTATNWTYFSSRFVGI